MGTDDGAHLFLFLVCLLFSSFFSVSETALMSLSKIRLRKMTENKEKNAETISKLLENPDKMLAAILVGNNLCNVAASAVITNYFIRVFSESGVIIATGIATVAILVFGEITPKTFALQNPEKVSAACSKFIYFVCNIFAPIVFVLNKISAFTVGLLGSKASGSLPTVTEEEILTMVNISHEEGVLEAEEKKMISNVFEFGDGDIGGIMTPKVNVITINEGDDYSQIIKIIKEYGYTRMPVLARDSDKVIGILNIKDILLSDTPPSEFDLNSIIRKPNFVYEFNNTAKVFNYMRKNTIPISIVLDEYGIMAGVVSVEDFIEEIIGEITDEYDLGDNFMQELNINEYLVDGSMSINDFNDVTGANIESHDFDSIGGFIIGKIGDIPTVDTAITYENMLFTVKSVENNRILSLHVDLK